MFYTHDTHATEGAPFIAQDATIYQADELPEGSWEIGDFTDCWVKTAREPELDDGMFDGIPVDVRGPGQHPGGREWWITPSVNVFVKTGE